ncbi:MAG: D-2-hydroxyacid dehydrogenase, partial [Candidatus Binatia bacterium]
MKIVVLDGAVLNPGDLSWQRLHEIAPTVVYASTTEEGIVERAQGAEIVLTNKTRLSAVTLKRLPHLRYIGVLATGYDSVDVAAARALGMTVTNIPTYSTASVAQFVFALLLELCHHVGLHSQEVKSGVWSREEWSFWKTPLI